MDTEASPVADSSKPLGKTLQRRATMPTCLGFLGKSHGQVPTQYQTYPEMGFSMGFYRDLMGFYRDLMGFYRDLMGYEWDIPSGKLT